MRVRLSRLALCLVLAAFIFTSGAALLLDRWFQTYYERHIVTEGLRHRCVNGECSARPSSLFSTSSSLSVSAHSSFSVSHDVGVRIERTAPVLVDRAQVLRDLELAEGTGTIVYRNFPYCDASSARGVEDGDSAAAGRGGYGGDGGGGSVSQVGFERRVNSAFYIMIVADAVAGVVVIISFFTAFRGRRTAGGDGVVDDYQPKRDNDSNGDSLVARRLVLGGVWLTACAHFTGGVVVLETFTSYVSCGDSRCSVAFFANDAEACVAHLIGNSFGLWIVSLCIIAETAIAATWLYVRDRKRHEITNDSKKKNEIINAMEQEKNEMVRRPNGTHEPFGASDCHTDEGTEEEGCVGRAHGESDEAGEESDSVDDGIAGVQGRDSRGRCFATGRRGRGGVRGRGRGGRGVPKAGALGPRRGVAANISSSTGGRSRVSAAQVESDEREHETTNRRNGDEYGTRSDGTGTRSGMRRVHFASSSPNATLSKMATRSASRSHEDAHESQEDSLIISRHPSGSTAASLAPDHRRRREEDSASIIISRVLGTSPIRRSCATSYPNDEEEVDDRRVIKATSRRRLALHAPAAADEPTPPRVAQHVPLAVDNSDRDAGEQAEELLQSQGLELQRAGDGVVEWFDPPEGFSEEVTFGDPTPRGEGGSHNDADAAVYYYSSARDLFFDPQCGHYYDDRAKIWFDPFADTWYAVSQDID